MSRPELSAAIALVRVLGGSVESDSGPQIVPQEPVGRAAIFASMPDHMDAAPQYAVDLRYATPDAEEIMQSGVKDLKIQPLFLLGTTTPVPSTLEPQALTKTAVASQTRVEYVGHKIDTLHLQGANQGLCEAPIVAGVLSLGFALRKKLKNLFKD